MCHTLGSSFTFFWVRLQLNYSFTACCITQTAWFYFFKAIFTGDYWSQKILDVYNAFTY